MENVTTAMNSSALYCIKDIVELDSVDYIFILLLIVIFLFGVIGNLLVVYVFKFMKSHSLNTTETLICYLALADLFASILNPIMFSYWIFTGHRMWHFGSAGCKILPSLTRCTVTFSFGIILIIAIDRYRVICSPLKRQKKSKQTTIAVFITLCVSILLEAPKLAYIVVTSSGNCDIGYENQRNVNYLYPRIVILITRDVAFLSILPVTLYFINNELVLKAQSSILKEQIDIKKLKNVVAMLASMATIFAILVLPRDIFHIVFEMSYLLPPIIEETKEVQHVNCFLKILHLCNSICNPFIYAKLHTQFRRKVVRMGKSLVRESKRRLIPKSNSYSGTAPVVFQERGEFCGVTERPQFSLTRYKTSSIHNSCDRETCV